MSIADELREIAAEKLERAAEHKQVNRWTHELQQSASALEDIADVLDMLAVTRLSFSWTGQMKLTKLQAGKLNRLRDIARA